MCVWGGGGGGVSTHTHAGVGGAEGSSSGSSYVRDLTCDLGQWGDGGLCLSSSVLKTLGAECVGTHACMHAWGGDLVYRRAWIIMAWIRTQPFQ